MDRIYKFLQVTALIIALIAPWIYFMGYAFDWGYLDSFSIGRQLFFKAPQEYFGIAYEEVFLVIISKLINSISEDVLKLTFLLIALTAVVVFTAIYWAYRKRFWPRLFLHASNFFWYMRGGITRRFVTTVAAPGYLASSIPVLSFAVVVYAIFFILLPPFVGYSMGQAKAKEMQAEWKKECSLQTLIVGCTQIIEGPNPIASGKLIAASEKHAAIYDGSSVQIYSLRGRDMRTALR